MADAVEFDTVSLNEWQEIPAPTPPKPQNRFEQLLLSVAEGKIVRVDVKDEKDLKGTRIGIARKARNLGFIVEFRNLGNTLYVKRSDKPLEEKPEEESGVPEEQEEKSSRKKEKTKTP